MKMNETKCTTDAKWICCTANVLSLRTLELNHRQKLPCFRCYAKLLPEAPITLKLLGNCNSFTVDKLPHFRMTLTEKLFYCTPRSSLTVSILIFSRLQQKDPIT